METTKKITLATVKSFIKKNSANLEIMFISSFDGMQDMVAHLPQSERVFQPATIVDNDSNSLGVKGAYFVGHSRDYFSAYNENGYTGIHVYNCCGSFNIAVKEVAAEEVAPVAEAPAPAEVKSGEVQIVDYSEKAFAVIGDTKPVKEVLKANGGKFNPFLKCGAGWIFSKKRMQEVTAALQAA